MRLPHSLTRCSVWWGWWPGCFQASAQLPSGSSSDISRHRNIKTSFLHEVLFSKPQDKMYPQLLGSQRDISQCTEFMVTLVEIWLKTCFWSVWMLQIKLMFSDSSAVDFCSLSDCLTLMLKAVWRTRAAAFDLENLTRETDWKLRNDVLFVSALKISQHVCLCVTRCQGEEEYTTNQITLVHQPRNALYLGHFFFLAVLSHFSTDFSNMPQNTS